MTDCIFCKIVAKEIPAKIAYEDDDLLAFHDIQPQAPTHILLIPKLHIATLNDLAAEHNDLMGKMLLKAKDLAKDNGLADNGYRIIMNCNQDGGQTVFHIHMHILGGRALQWPPG